MANDVLIRLGVFLGLFAILACAEALLPKRTRQHTRRRRWVTNISITVFNSLTLRLMAVILPLLAIGAAIDANTRGWGLFGTLDWPHWVETIIAILILDFVIWAQHLVTHKIPILWRLHRVHHADIDIDVTTAIRFHPIEIALSMLLKIGVVYLLGPTGFAVLLFEVLLNSTAMFNHANLSLPARLDRFLRLFIVTPDMHRVHHSVHRDEHDSNYGFSLSIWDRFFGTYIPQPKGGHDDMTTGLEWQNDNPSKLGWSLMLPFRSK